MAAPASPRPPCPSCGFALVDAGAVNFCPSCGQDLREGARTPPPPSPSVLNTVVADRYRLLSLLGEGGMGAVYKAEHIRMGKALALKLLGGAFARDESAVARFRAEAQIVSRLSHPHTIAVFDFGELPDAGGFYLAMEYVPGKDLAKVLREAGRLPAARVVEVGQQILGSLAEAHDAGIVHRDMKPGNVMLMQTRSGEDYVKVLDFGIAKWRDEAQGATTTSVGAIVGTPNYLSPEQARGELIDARADLYSLGALLYELTAGRPPFHGMPPLAVVSAHLHDAPPPLASLAPDVPEDLAAVIHRALEKHPADRWASADEMRGALLQLASPPARGRSGPPTPRTSAVVTGELRLAKREDFAEFEREVSRLRRSRVAAPASAALLLALAALAIWRWGDLYGLVQARAPGLAGAIPTALRPADFYDGAEHEPNNAPALANPLPLPAGPDGAPAGGVASMRGFIGAKASDTAGDIDVYKVEIPPGAARRVLVAEWSGEQPGEGIRGLDVQLTLNRQRAEGSARSSAPLVASVDHGGPGRPERLSAAVSPGTWFLAVREKHAEETGPVEKPSDAYRLTVHLADPEPGVEVEPNDEPEDAAARFRRYPEWRALAQRNSLGEGRLRGDLGPGDADTLAVGPGAPGEAPAWLLLVPEPDLAVAVETWRPDAGDLDALPSADRVRFEPAASGGPGEVLLVSLGGVPDAGAPALVRLTSPRGSGAWVALGLGTGAASGAAVLSLADELVRAGRVAQALELLAAVGRSMPGASAHAELLLAAGRIAEAAAAGWTPAELPRLERAARRLGAPVLLEERGALRYRAAFEALASGSGAQVEAAALRVAVLGAPCTAAAVAVRAGAFARRFPQSALLPEARRAEARALEAAFFEVPVASRRERSRAFDRSVAAWKALRGSAGEVGAEAARRLEALTGAAPTAAGAEPVCQ